ncbi:sensor histidine kinase [Stieleria varia]|uniref:sensor histidine kinase n=1 Tax=Stieleria varia TaxID=2528005 RepID=UPI0018D23D1E|nr:HAMP domain-containing sensor histidine kinase [Stieleria varia]
MTVPTPSATTDTRTAIHGVTFPATQAVSLQTPLVDGKASVPLTSDHAGAIAGPDPSTIRLISETAHDLRAPLNTIRESVRLVRDGELGRLTPSQNEFLSAAIDQCDCVDQMVDEMVHMQRLNSGFPRARRRWVALSEIKDAVSNTLRPWTLPRNVHILWDGPSDMSTQVFGDAAMLRRLVVNLVTNAIRVTAEGDPILVRMVPVSGGRMLRWSVVDQGSGISPADMEAIARDHSPSGSGGGLGLLIAKQLAAVHYSPLWIESRINTGTVVSFETCIGGPSSVARAWADWRRASEAAGKNENPPRVRSFVRQQYPPRDIYAPRRVRIDVPTVLVELREKESIRPAGRQIIIGGVDLGAATSLSVAAQFDEALHSAMAMGEMAYRVGQRSWTWVFQSDPQAVRQRIQHVERQARDRHAGLRLSWGQAINLGELNKHTAIRLSDFLVRQSLRASRRHISDADQVRLGTQPIVESSIATRRLDDEARRLDEYRRLNRR